MHNHNSLFIIRIIATPWEHQGWTLKNGLDAHILGPRKQNFLVFTFVPFPSVLQTLFSMMSCNIIDEIFLFSVQYALGNNKCILICKTLIPIYGSQTSHGWRGRHYNTRLLYPESDGYTKINPLPTVTSALAMATPEAPFGVHSSSPVGSCTISDMTAAFWWCSGSQAIWLGFELVWKYKVKV